MNTNLFNNDPTSNEILIKQHMLEKAIENNSLLKDVNFDGSNMSTLISALNYVLTVLNIKNELIYNEISDDAELDKNILSKIKTYNYVPRTDVSSKILLEIKQTEDSVTNGDIVTYNEGDILYANTPDYSYYYIFDTTTTINDTYVKLLFTEGEFKSDTYILTNNLNYVILEGYKWDIDNDTLVVIDNSTGLEITLFSNDDDDVTVNDNLINNKFYFLDYTDDNGIKLVFSDGLIGQNVNNEVTISFKTTVSTEANDISQEKFNLDNDKIEIQLTENINSSYGGIKHQSIQSIRELMSKIYKLQNRIVTRSDLESYLEYLFTNIWQSKIIDTSDLNITALNLGLIYVSMYMLDENGNVTDMNYDSFINEWDIIKSKSNLGLSIIKTKYEYVNVKINYTLTLNISYTNEQYNIINKINKILLDNINVNGIKTLNKQLIQMYVVQEAIEGMVDFTVDTLAIGLNVTEDDDLSSTFKIKNYNLYNDVRFEYLINDNVVEIPKSDLLFEEGGIYLDSDGYDIPLFPLLANYETIISPFSGDEFIQYSNINEGGQDYHFVSFTSDFTINETHSIAQHEPDFILNANDILLSNDKVVLVTL